MFLTDLGIEYKPLIPVEIIGDENAIELNEMFKNLNYQFISIDEVNLSREVEKLWDNDHHNFLVCNSETINFLKEKNLIQQ